MSEFVKWACLALRPLKECKKSLWRSRIILKIASHFEQKSLIDELDVIIFCCLSFFVSSAPSFSIFCNPGALFFNGQIFGSESVLFPKPYKVLGSQAGLKCGVKTPRVARTSLKWQLNQMLPHPVLSLPNTILFWGYFSLLYFYQSLTESRFSQKSTYQLCCLWPELSSTHVG